MQNSHKHDLNGLCKFSYNSQVKYVALEIDKQGEKAFQ